MLPPCENCGGPCRTRKYHGWVCKGCDRLLERLAAARAEAAARVEAATRPRSLYA